MLSILLPRSAVAFLMAILAPLSAFAFPVVLNFDLATSGVASPTQAVLVGGVVEVGWLNPGTTKAQIQALAAAGDFAGIDAVFNQVASFSFPSAAVDFDSGGGQYFESVTIVPSGDAAGLAAYQSPTSGAAGKAMFLWVRDNANVAGTTQMAFVDCGGTTAGGVTGLFPPAVDPLGSDFAETIVTAPPPSEIDVWVGSAAPVITGSAIDNSGAGNTANDGVGATGSTTVLQLASVVVSTEASMQFSAGSASVVENGTSVTVTVTRTGKLDSAVSVQFATVNGTAVAGTDFTSTSGVLNFAVSDVSETITVPIADRSGFQGDRSFGITLSNPTPAGTAVVGAPATIAVTIQDDDPAMAGALQFSAASYSAAENASSVAVVVRRVGGSDGAVSATVSTANGSAVAPGDFTAVNQTVSFAAGDAADKTVNILLADDTTFEGDETFTVALSGPTGGATLGAPSSATVTVTDNETPPTSGSLSFTAATFTGAENGGTIAVSVARTAGSTGAVSVQYVTADGSAIAPADYTATSGTLSWANGETGSKTFTVPVIDNQIDGPNKSFTVALLSPTGGASTVAPATATVTITDDDVAGTFAFANATATVSEAAGQVTLTIARTGGTAGPVDVLVSTTAGPDPAAAAGDFESLTNRVVSFVNGQTSATVNVGVVDNTVFSGSRNFQATLSTTNPSAVIGTPGSATVTITENDPPVPGRLSLSSAAYAAAEGTPVATITVLRTDGSDGPVSATLTTVNGTARAPGDFTATTTQVSFANGETSKDVTIPIIDDNLFEPAETLTVRMSSPTNGASLTSRTSAVVTIADNEPSYSFASAQVSAAEGASAAIVVTRRNAPARSQSVDYRIASGTATAGRDFIAASGTLVFPAGVAEQTITIPIVDDGLPESAESFSIRLAKANANDTSVGLATPSATVVTIARSNNPNEQPDLSVNNGSRFVGSGIINTNGTNQSATRTGKSVTYPVRIRNAGDVRDTIVLTGVQGGSAQSGSIRVTYGNADITRAVLSADGFSFPNVAVGSQVEVRVTASVGSGPRYSGWGVTLRAASAGASSKVDVIRVSAIKP